MSLPAVPPAELAEVIREVTEYVQQQRSHYLPLAVSLSAEQKANLKLFFPAAVLEQARVYLLPPASFPNPAFVHRAWARGFRHMPDYAHLQELTFQDVVLLQEPGSDRWLFHGLVHVVQAQVLGLERYVAAYLHAFVNTGRHVTVPLEVQAFQLDERFAATPAEPFSVEDAVRDWERRRLY
jgi:hypothetical protein